MNRKGIVFVLLIAVVFAIGLNAFAQQPGDLLKSAQAVYGLNTAGLKPWHLKATYQLYDKKGTPTEKGTFEEYWVSPTQYRQSFSRPSYHQTLWAAADGRLYHAKGDDSVSVYEETVARQLVNPLPTEAELAGHRLRVSSMTVSGAELSCFVLETNFDIGKMFGLMPTYCFAASRMALLLSAPYAAQRVDYGGIGRFQGRYVSTSIHLQEEMGKEMQPYLDIKIEALGLLSQVDPTLFALPADAEPEKTHRPSPTIESMRKHPIEPEFSSGVGSGPRPTVTIHCIVDRSGEFHNIQFKEASSVEAARTVLTFLLKSELEPQSEQGKPTESEFSIEVRGPGLSGIYTR